MWVNNALSNVSNKWYFQQCSGIRTSEIGQSSYLWKQIQEFQHQFKDELSAYLFPVPLGKKNLLQQWSSIQLN